MTMRLLLLGITTTVLFSCGAPSNDQQHELTHTTTKDTNIVSTRDTNTASLQPQVVTSKRISLPVADPKHMPATTKHIVPAVTSIAEDLKSISKTFQTFAINNTTDTTITCKEGTTIKVKANSFAFASGQGQVTSNVVIAVKEFYSLGDMLAASLSTKSGDAILETGGMIYIEAKAEGQPCVLREGATMDVMFPYKQRKEGMQLFLGEWKENAVDWALSKKQNVVATTIYVRFHDQARIREFVARNLQYPYLDTALFVYVMVAFDVAENGRIDNVVVKTPVRKDFENNIINVFKRVPPVKPATVDGRPVRSSQSMQITVAPMAESVVFNTSDNNYKKDFEATMDSASLNTATSQELNRYVFSVSKIGWLNCDRFFYDNRPMFNYAVNTGEYEDLDVKLVFSSLNAILPGQLADNGYLFKRVPEGEKVTIVAIKKFQGVHYFATAKTTTSATPFDGLHFKQVTMQQLKEQLEMLNRN